MKHRGEQKENKMQNAMRTLKLYDEVRMNDELWEVTTIEECDLEDVPYVVLSREYSPGYFDREYMRIDAIKWNNKLNRWEV